MIGLYGCAADSNQIFRLDDPELLTDTDEQVKDGLWGDVNDDGVVDIVDSLQLAAYFVGNPVTNLPALLWRGDVTQDGNRNLSDAQQIGRFVNGLSYAPLINTFRVGDRVFVPSPFPAYLVAAPVEGGAFAALRRIAQNVTVQGPVTITITPIVDGALREDQVQTLVIDPANGVDQLLEAHALLGGSQFAFRLDVTALGGAFSVGGSSWLIVPRRTTRGG